MIVPKEEQSLLTIYYFYDQNENIINFIPNYQVFLYFDYA